MREFTFTYDEQIALEEALVTARVREKNMLSILEGLENGVTSTSAAYCRERIDDYNALLTRLRSAPVSK